MKLLRNKWFQLFLLLLLVHFFPDATNGLPLFIGAIAYDSHASVAATPDVVTPLTLAHTVVSNTNGLMTLGITQSNETDQISGITYAGVALTKITAAGLNDSGFGRVDMWYLKAPATGANNIVITVANTVFLGVGSIAFTGVDQTTPIGASATNTGTSTTVLSQNITTTAANSMLRDHMGKLDSFVNPMNADTGQTERYEVKDGVGNLGAGSHKLATTTGSYAMGWNWNGDFVERPKAMCIIEIMESGGGGGGTAVKDMLGGGIIPFAR